MQEHSFWKCSDTLLYLFIMKRLCCAVILDRGTLPPNTNANVASAGVQFNFGISTLPRIFLRSYPSDLLSDAFIRSQSIRTLSVTNERTISRFNRRWHISTAVSVGELRERSDEVGNTASGNVDGYFLILDLYSQSKKSVEVICSYSSFNPPYVQNTVCRTADTCTERMLEVGVEAGVDEKEGTVSMVQNGTARWLALRMCLYTARKKKERAKWSFWTIRR